MMANELAKLFIVIGIQSDELTKGLQQVQSQITAVSKLALGVGGALTGAFALSVAEAQKMAESHQRLGQSLKNIGVSYDAVKSSINALLDAQVRTTNYSDEEQLDALNSLVFTTGSYDKALAILPEALDLAAAKQMGLAEASLLLGKVNDNVTARLKTMGIILSETALKEAAAGDSTRALAEIWDKVRGAAAATANPFIQLKNTVGELSEAIGATLLPALKSIITPITDIVSRVKDWIEINPIAARGVTEFASAIGGLLLAVGGLGFALPGIEKTIGTVVTSFRKLQGGILGTSGALAGAGWIGAIAAVGLFAKSVGDAAMETWKLNEALIAQQAVLTNNEIRVKAALGEWKYFGGTLDSLKGNLKSFMEGFNAEPLKVTTEALKATQVAIAEVTYQYEGASMRASLFTEAQIRQQRALARTVTTTGEAAEAAKRLAAIHEQDAELMRNLEERMNAATAAQERLNIMTGRIAAGTRDMQQSIASATWMVDGYAYSMSLFTEAEIEAAEAAGKKISRLDSQDSAMNKSAEATKRATISLTGFTTQENLTAEQAEKTKNKVQLLLANLKDTAFGSSAMFGQLMNSINSSGIDTMTLIENYLAEWSKQTGESTDSVKTDVAALLAQFAALPTEKRINIIMNYITTGNAPGTTTTTPGTTTTGNTGINPDTGMPINPGTIGYSPPIFDMGAIVTRPTVAALAQNYRPEAVIPLGSNLGTTVNLTVQGNVWTTADLLKELTRALSDRARLQRI